jgi:alanine racemase
MSRPLVAVTDIDAMRSNLAVAQGRVPGARVWAVVKADAYGHGLHNALLAFESADGLALVELDRAVMLRELGWRKPILLMEGMFDRAELTTVRDCQLEIVVHNDEQMAMLAAAGHASIPVHLKVNTGMNRLGFRPTRVREVFAKLKALPSVSRVSLMTHFANAENSQATLTPELQMQHFLDCTSGLDAEISLPNSAALLMAQHPLRSDWIRPGVMLYGGVPGNGSPELYGLKPAMTLRSELISVQDLRPGDSVGYGSVFSAATPMRVGVVACGYADGYPRHAPTGTPVLVDGVRTRLLGRVSMDMLSVDLTPVPQARIGSSVTLWGEGLPIDEVAEAAGTIGYELMCAITPRVRRAAQDSRDK